MADPGPVGETLRKLGYPVRGLGLRLGGIPFNCSGAFLSKDETSASTLERVFSPVRYEPSKKLPYVAYVETNPRGTALRTVDKVSSDRTALCCVPRVRLGSLFY